jgi:hypothetical protein
MIVDLYKILYRAGNDVAFLLPCFEKSDAMKTILNLLVLSATLFTLSSCATVLGGKVGPCQRTPTVAGQPMREIRVAALLANLVLFPPGIFVDFMTGAIFKPCGEDRKMKQS